MTAHSCRPSTCTNGKCRATGECIEVEVARARLPRVASPPLVPPLPSGMGHALSFAIEAGRRATCEIDPENCGCAEYICRPNGGRTVVAYDDEVTTDQIARINDMTRSEFEDGTWIEDRIIVAFTGRAGSGKSTAAAHLIKRHGYQRVRFAGPLKAMLAALGCTSEQIDGSEKETPCELLGGKTPRHAMQTLGTEWGRDLIAPDLWIRAWQAAVARVPAGVPIVVDDLRFPNEAAAIRAAGGVIVAVDRPGAGDGAAGHVSEQHDLPCDQTLRNIADEQYLRDQVDILVMDLSWRDQLHETRAASASS